jgi:hypothetical protein
LNGSAGDRPVTASQRRTLSTLTGATRFTRVIGGNSIRAGLDFQRFPVREHFTLGITDPRLNAAGAPTFNPKLLPHDLTRGGAPFVFDDRRTGLLMSAFVQSTVRRGPATLTLGRGTTSIDSSCVASSCSHGLVWRISCRAVSRVARLFQQELPDAAERESVAVQLGSRGAAWLPTV